MAAGLIEAEGAVHGQPDLPGVGVLLAVVLPPADGAELKALRSGQGAVAAARAAIEVLHAWMDGF
jgi:hypothetical protein